MFSKSLLSILKPGGVSLTKGEKILDRVPAALSVTFLVIQSKTERKTPREMSSAQCSRTELRLVSFQDGRRYQDQHRPKDCFKASNRSVRRALNEVDPVHPQSVPHSPGT